MHQGLPSSIAPEGREELADGNDNIAPAIRWLAARRQTLLVALTLVLLAGGAFAVRRLIADANYDTVIATLLSMPWWRLAVAGMLTVASFVALTLYDANAFAALGQRRRWRDIAPGAFAAYAVGQTVGFGPLSGTAVRMRFYLPMDVTPADVARVVGFVTISFGFGLATLAALGSLVLAPDVAAVVGISPELLRAASLVVLAGVIVVLALGGRGLRINLLGVRRIELPPTVIMLRQLAVSAADVAAAAGVLWVLLPPGSVSYATFLPIFAVAIAAGVVSHVPAGLGVFEASVLASLGNTAAPSSVLAALALYRLIYHALPVAVAAFGIAGAELTRLTASAEVRGTLRAFAGLAPQALGALALLLGAMLVFSGVTPAKPDDLDFLGTFLPLPLLEGAHFVASVMGVALMIAARGLAYRLTGAWYVALAAAVLALVLSVAKALAVYEAAALAIFALLLSTTRRRFSRPAAILSQTLTPPWLAAIASVLIVALVILLFVYNDSDFSIEHWGRFELAAEAPRGLRALVGAGLLAGIATFWSLLRPAAHEPPLPSPADLERALAIVARQDAPDANLVRTGDKRLMFAEEGEAFIMYGRQGRSWIALFDPVGPRELWPALIWRFVETARQSGGRAVFYEIGAESLSLYADAGLNCLKLGEEARIDLAAFTLEGPGRKDLRYVLNRGRRDGLEVEILRPEAAAEAFDDLARISAQWIARRSGGEKGFSLGAFTRDYVRTQRIAVLRGNGRILAFASLMETGTGAEVTVDLMRQASDVPGVGMDFLFLRLFELLKAEGASWFSLGMAPLSGLKDSEAAPAWHRFGNLVFQHGTRFYNFKGLRGFKSKFQPVWRSRYLAVSGGLSPALALIDVARLIGGGPKEAKR